MSALPSPAPCKTFSEYIRSDAFYRRLFPKMNAAADEFLRDYLASANIKSLFGLYRWVRERYPDHYFVDTNGISGQMRVRVLWADYLLWAEVEADES